MYDYSGINLQHMQFFISIAEQGSMNKAAEILHVSPSLLSQRITQLESMIGFDLFRRLRQRLYLTAAGEQLLVDFKDILARVHYVLDSARETCDHQRPLTIGFTVYQETNPSFYVFLNEFKKTYPSLEFTVEIQPRNQLQASFLDGKIDIIAIPDFDRLRQDKEIQSKIAFMVPVGCYMNDSLPVSKKDSLIWKDLDGLTCILPEHLKNSAFTRDLKRKFAAENITIPIRYHNGDVMTVSRLVRVNNYITFASYRFVEDAEPKCIIIQDFSYPYIVAWHKDTTENISSYAQMLHSIISKKVPISS